MPINRTYPRSISVLRLILVLMILTFVIQIIVDAQKELLINLCIDPIYVCINESI